MLPTAYVAGGVVVDFADNQHNSLKNYKSMISNKNLF